jgi:hypothetical protein
MKTDKDLIDKGYPKAIKTLFKMKWNINKQDNMFNLLHVPQSSIRYNYIKNKHIRSWYFVSIYQSTLHYFAY